MANKEMKIQDFGKKIGGAKKDLWRARGGLTLADIQEMTPEEKAKYVTRDEIWPKPDWEKLIDDGLDPAVAWWINNVRVSIEPKPLNSFKTVDYISTVEMMKERLSKVKTEDDVKKFFRILLPEIAEDPNTYYVKIKAGIEGINSKTFKAMQTGYYKASVKAQKTCFGVAKDRKEYVSVMNSISIICFDGESVKEEKDYSGKQMFSRKKGFCTTFYYPERDVERIEMQIGTYFVSYCNSIEAYNLTEDEAKAFADEYCQKWADKIKESKAARKEKSAASRKTKFNPEDPGEMERIGGLILDRDITGQDYLDTFKFYGGEFGNWVNQKERQDNLNNGYYAMTDLARILNIDFKWISFNGKLSIAFGARGRGKASAHYEPLLDVINLTKPRGAGCLAHEWGHALDAFIGKHYGARTGKLASECFTKETPQVFKDLVVSLQYQDGKPTEFYKGSKKFGGSYSREGGYWDSTVEMFARAFDCYVSDKLKEKGWKSGYLCGGANSFWRREADGSMTYAIPMGKEREAINKGFDKLFDYLRQELFV